MAIVHFITHPEVVIDPAVPVPDWPLSSLGLRRGAAMLAQPWINPIGAIFTSAERKARDLARLIADHLGLSYSVREDLGENDRSATGYLPRSQFEALADQFFAHPNESVRGWERATDAQRRIIQAVDSALAATVADTDIAICSHGGVGALLLCHLKGVAISRAEDQPGNGGGNVYRFDAASRRLISGWRRIEDRTDW